MKRSLEQIIKLTQERQYRHVIQAVKSYGINQFIKDLHHSDCMDDDSKAYYLQRISFLLQRPLPEQAVLSGKVFIADFSGERA